MSGHIPEMGTFTKDLQYRETRVLWKKLQGEVLFILSYYIRLYALILGAYPPPQAFPSLLILAELDKS